MSISRDDLYNCILHLVPEARFSFWAEGSQDWVKTVPMKKYKIEKQKVTCLKYKDEKYQVKKVDPDGNPILDKDGKAVIEDHVKQVACFEDDMVDCRVEYWEDVEVKGTCDMGCEQEITMDGWIIDWRKENAQSCPTLDEIKKLDLGEVNAGVAARIKLWRNHEKAKDLSLVAAYQAALQFNPKLVFSDFIDTLEKISADLLKTG